MTDDEEERALAAIADETAGTVLKALDGPLMPLAPAVFMPPGMAIALADNRIAREHLADALNAGWTPPTIEDDKMRIQRELDPIGMAIAIAQGMAIPVFVPKPGGVVEVKYLQVPTKTRIQVMNKLLDRIAPPAKTSVRDKKNDGPVDPHKFLAMVRRAAEIAEHRMSNAKIIDHDQAIVTGDASDEERGMLEDE